MEWGVIYAGSTDNPRTRANAHRSKDGYWGKLFYAPTQNMMVAEDELLKKRKYRYNKQKESNAEENRGFIYVIQGKREF